MHNHVPGRDHLTRCSQNLDHQRDSEIPRPNSSGSGQSSQNRDHLFSVDQLTRAYQNLHLQPDSGSHPYVLFPQLNTYGLNTYGYGNLPVSYNVGQGFNGVETALVPNPIRSETPYHSGLDLPTRLYSPMPAFNGSGNQTGPVSDGIESCLYSIMTNSEEFRIIKDYDSLANILSSRSELFFQLSIHQCGSHLVRRLIKLLRKSVVISKMVKTIALLFNRLMVHPMGSFVATDCFALLDSGTNDVLYAAGILYAFELARDKHGCVSLNRLIQDIRGLRRDQLLNVITNHARCLAQDPYGSYVIQRLLQLYNPDICARIWYQLRGCFVDLALSKSGSYVVDRCIVSPAMEIVVRDLIQSDQLLRIAKNTYGNYVIQNALKETKGRNPELYQQLMAKLIIHRNELMVGPSKHIYRMIAEHMIAG